MTADIEQEEKEPDGIIITDEYRRALQLLTSSARPNLFITGNAGTGKSTLLRHICETVSARKNIVVVAPTGIAALNVGGQTIHSFFRIKPKPLLDPNEDVQVWYNRKDVFKAVDIMIVDEVSMLRADLLDCMDMSLRVHRDQPTKLFGGVQMVFFGDLCQLPPVVGDEIRVFMDTAYATQYFFSAQCLRRGHTHAPLELVELTRPFRQEGDPQFLDILNRTRTNSLTTEDVQELNTVCAIDQPWPDGEQAMPLEITSTNEMAIAINRRRLATIDAPMFTYGAQVNGQFEPKLFPTEGQLDLKVGAQVMLLRNSKTGEYVNGSIGRIVHLKKDRIVVDIADAGAGGGGGECEIEPTTWERFSYDTDRMTKKMVTRTVGTFEQYPVRLGWAVTIHKSQGQTFDRVIVDFGRGAFAHGQAYVALSRCRTMAGLRLRSGVCLDDIIFDNRVLEYLATFNKESA
jgi:ATP-dependent exoDNAse (exonuclease V) alpha subunit